MILGSDRRWNLLAQYLKPLHWQVAGLTLLIFVSIGLQLVNPQIISTFIDTATQGNDSQTLIRLALVFLAASTLLQGVNILATYVSEDIGWRSTNHLREDLTRHCLKLDSTFQASHTPGELIERINGDVIKISFFFSQFVIRIAANGVLLVGVLVVLSWQDWRVSLALALYALIAVVGLTYLHETSVPQWKAAQQANADLFGFLGEHLASTEAIRPNGATAYVMHHLFRFSKSRFDTHLRSESRDTLIIALWFTLRTAGQFVALLSGYSLYRQGVLSLGSVYLIILYTEAIFHPLTHITDQLQNVQQSFASLDRVQALFSQKSTMEQIGTVVLPAGPLGVSFENVSFAYNENRPVLRQISFSLQPGKVISLLGRTGSGKTTITRLLFRLYDPTTGTVRLSSACGPAFSPEGVDLRDVDLASLRRRVGLVTQDVQLFNASVRDNLTFFDPSIPDEQILDVIHKLGLSTWYASLPQALDTMLDAGGASLSAGEAQLLAFTRVFLKDPGLVILDEASSRLDPATEQLIDSAVSQLLHNRTGIIVAHRLRTTQRADQLMILEQGQVLEYGDRATLAHDTSSRFYHLLQTDLDEVLV